MATERAFQVLTSTRLLPGPLASRAYRRNLAAPAPARHPLAGRAHTALLVGSGLPAPQPAPPAVDVLFDIFEFVFSPAGLSAIGGLIALGVLWDVATAAADRTLLGQKKSSSLTLLGQTYDTSAASAPSRFALKFSSKDDGFYESPRGGAERIEAGVAYIEEFDELAQCVSLGKALQRRLGKDRVEFATFEVRGDNWIERPASSASLTKGPGARGSDSPAAAAAPPAGVEDAEDTAGGDDVDREWRSVMEQAKLLKRKDVGLEGVELRVITGETACRLCNGRGFRGCSSCSTPANVGDGLQALQQAAAAGTADGAACQACGGSMVVPCEWCKGSGERATN